MFELFLNLVLTGFSIIVGAILLYTASRLITSAYFRSKKEYEKLAEKGEKSQVTK